MWSIFIMSVCNLALYKTMERVWSQEAEISRQTSISPTPHNLPQETAGLRHAPASASLSGQKPNSGNILQPVVAAGLVLQRQLFPLEGFKVSFKIVRWKICVVFLDHIFILISFSFNFGQSGNFFTKTACPRLVLN